MEIFLNRLEILFCNAVLSKKVDQKEIILNKVLNLLKFYRIITDLMNYLYSYNPELFQEFLIKFNKPSLILLTYDLNAIGKAIVLPEDRYLTFYNNSFRIEYKPTSPTSQSSNYSEWGY